MALAVPVLSMPLSGIHVAWAYAPPAPPAKTLPTGLDVAVPYQGQTICDPRPRPGTLAFAQLMTTYYTMGSTSLIGRTCTSGTSEHFDGRAWDWMLNVTKADQYAVAQSVLTWLTAPDAQGRPGAMARRFGIMYIIYNKKMWRAYDPARGWATYTGSNPHTDHIHFSFTYDGAAKRTSWWTGAATTWYLTTLPPAAGSASSVVTVPSTPTVLSYGMRSEAVRQLQLRLGNLPTTGYFGDQTRARVLEYQRFAGLRQTGIADLKTQEILAYRGWRSVAAAWPALSYGTTSTAVKTLQAKLGGLPTTGYFGSLTKARVIAYQKFVGLPQTGVADSVTQARLWVRGWTGTAAATPTYPTLSYGMSSSAVKTLQTKLGGLPVTGYFGPLTKARVIAYQRFVGLSQTGIADSRTQQLLYTRGWSTIATSTSTSGGAAMTTSLGAGREAQVVTAVTNPRMPSAAVATVSMTTPYTPYKSTVLAPGARGMSVRELQTALGGLAVDGVFGVVTRERVVALQRSHALPPTGIVTPDVWDLLEERDFPFVSNRSTVLRVGDTGETVTTIQRLLGVAETGVYDPPTREAVKAAQARAGLASTGVVASRTWSLLDRLSA
jgi:peptidoglycan hydrolase-like protein with peptidoglycan-binding domain